MKYLDLFSGYGGFSLGIQQAYGNNLSSRNGETKERDGETDTSLTGVETAETDTQRPRNTSSHQQFGNIGEVSCIGFSEIDKYATQVYQKHFPYEECENCRLERNRQEDIRLSGRQEAVNRTGADLSQAERQDRRTLDSPPTKNNCECKYKTYGDITKLDPTTLPDFDLLCGGFPCQAFSIAGKRAGFEDTRGTLIYDVLRIVKEKHPRLVLLENVKGLISHDNGRTFKTIISAIAELGYAVEWQVLNAKNFGVPQNRERVFIVGHLGGFSGRAVFPIGEAEKSDIQPTKELSVQISNTLRTNYSNGFSNETYVQSNQSGLRQIRELPDYSDSWVGQTHPADFRIRRLTPTECERLMGLPDGWTEKGLSYIMEICVNTTNAIEKQLLALDSVLCTISDGRDMEVRICQSEKKEYANIVIDQPLLVDTAIATTNPLSDMVMLFNPSETLSIGEFIKRKDTYEKMDGKSTSKLWKVSLVGSYEKERLSIILTSIRETMKKITSTSAKTGENIIGVIIPLNSSEQNSLKEASLVLKMGSIESISDTQRYKLCGNGVVVNVVEEIIKRLK